MISGVSINYDINYHWEGYKAISDYSYLFSSELISVTVSSNFYYLLLFCFIGIIHHLTILLKNSDDDKFTSMVLLISVLLIYLISYIRFYAILFIVTMSLAFTASENYLGTGWNITNSQGIVYIITKTTMMAYIVSSFIIIMILLIIFEMRGVKENPLVDSNNTKNDTIITFFLMVVIMFSHDYLRVLILFDFVFFSYLQVMGRIIMILSIILLLIIGVYQFNLLNYMDHKIIPAHIYQWFSRYLKEGYLKIILVSVSLGILFLFLLLFNFILQYPSDFNVSFSFLTINIAALFIPIFTGILLYIVTPSKYKERIRSNYPLIRYIIAFILIIMLIAAMFSVAYIYTTENQSDGFGFVVEFNPLTIGSDNLTGYLSSPQVSTIIVPFNLLIVYSLLDHNLTVHGCYNVSSVEYDGYFYETENSYVISFEGEAVEL
jgi:hypothetical protein